VITQLPTGRPCMFGKGILEVSVVWL
jgi:hypothetical protein